MYQQKFALVSLSLEVTVPHHLIQLSGTELMSDLIGAVAQGAIPAELNILVANQDASLEQVPDIILRFWESRLTANSLELTAAGAALSNAELDDVGRIKSPFLWFPSYTPLAEVRKWLQGAKKQ